MPVQAERSGAGSDKWVASITYRSEAVRPPSVSELQQLVAASRARNRSVGITGMLLHDGGRFLQTLEGPPEAVDQIWSSIQQDRRHGAIEVLSQHIIPARLFSEWDLRLYDRSGGQAKAAPSRPGNAIALTDHVPAMARFALAGDDSRLNALIADLVADGWVGDALVQHLLEPTARLLGDTWLADDCTELDLTIALSMLQLAGHTVHSQPSPDSIRKSRYSVLLATAPGEPHILGSTLLGDMFINAGWDVDMVSPESDEALTRQLRSQRPDAVDIALSDALPRQHALALLRETVEKARHALPNEVIVVSVGGRLFAEAAATALSVGADHARRTAAGTTIRLARLVEQRASGTRDPDA
ncbi:methanogenic corrinoid protein MtbC1 [Sphingomonas vulcanisoli]|uniref:Methanogenic corrinoid protein MtbC1 n=1 Tax=Sphingomonas vulcanisoli TaxID=1658060 RepID=A0ABX0TPV8_9SPHN|nr:BLUF domain-containing protein [Sphingomonas vulcanisoli]NIJ07573.1 methanogenic corrinoid protein MtbC1 [Sphingomonas vulcanisoli]